MTTQANIIAGGIATLGVVVVLLGVFTQITWVIYFGIILLAGGIVGKKMIS